MLQDSKLVNTDINNTQSSPPFYFKSKCSFEASEFQCCQHHKCLGR